MAKNYDINPCLMKHIVHNFSSCNLSQVEINALSYGLDHRILNNINTDTHIKIKTKILLFKRYWAFLKFKDNKIIP